MAIQLWRWHGSAVADSGILTPVAESAWLAAVDSLHLPSPHPAFELGLLLYAPPWQIA